MQDRNNKDSSVFEKKKIPLTQRKQRKAAFCTSSSSDEGEVLEGLAQQPALQRHFTRFMQIHLLRTLIHKHFLCVLGAAATTKLHLTLHHWNLSF